MKLPIRGLLYIVSICLCFWYATVLYWAQIPNVCPEYKLYYLDKKLIDWPGYGGLSYNLGEKIFFKTDDNGMQKVPFRGQGWSGIESWGTWTIGHNADLFFALEDDIDSDLIMTTKATAFRPGGYQLVDVSVNNEMVGALNFKHSEIMEYNIKIPKKLSTKSEIMNINFNIHNPASPEQYGLSNDNRLLGIGLVWLQIDKT